MKEQNQPDFRSIKESGYLLMAIGGTFFVLGILYLCDLIIINSTFVCSIAISGLLLVMSDFFENGSSSNAQKKEYKTKSSRIYFLRVICLVGSIFALIGLPYIIKVSEKTDIFSTGLSIITIGITIINIAFKYISQGTKDIDYLLDLADEQSKTADKAIKIAESAIAMTENQNQQSDNTLVTSTHKNENSVINIPNKEIESKNS